MQSRRIEVAYRDDKELGHSDAGLVPGQSVLELHGRKGFLRPFGRNRVGMAREKNLIGLVAGPSPGILLPGLEGELGLGELLLEVRLPEAGVDYCIDPDGEESVEVFVESGEAIGRVVEIGGAAEAGARLVEQ